MDCQLAYRREDQEREDRLARIHGADPPAEEPTSWHAEATKGKNPKADDEFEVFFDGSKGQSLIGDRRSVPRGDA